MSLAEQAILQSILDGDTAGVGVLTAAALRQEARARGMRPSASAETLGSVHESAGPKDDAQGGQP
jgi:hypothetical protein